MSKTDFDGLDSIGDVNAVMESLVSQPPMKVQLGSLEQCIAELALTLAKVSNIPAKDRQRKTALSEALKAPIDQIGGALKDLFVPGDDELPEDTGEAIQAYASQVSEAFRDPVLAFIKTQKALFNTELDRLGDVFLSGYTDAQGKPKAGYFPKVWDTLHFLFTQLFYDSEKSGTSIAGMLWYAVSEVIPATDVELRYLKRMKKAVRGCLEGVANLPPNMQPGIPNLWATTELCEVEKHLKRVAEELQSKSTWNRGEFGSATTHLCDAAAVMGNGVLPLKGREFVKNLTGWDDRQLNSLQSMAFLPDVGFRFKLIELTTLNRYLQQQDRHVKSFYRNLKGFLDTLASLTNVDLGDVLSVIVMVIRNHVAIIRADMKAQADGFLNNQAAQDYSKLESDKKIKTEVDKSTGQTKIVGTGATAKEVTAAKEATNTDVFSYMSSQATNFAALSALCFIFKKIQAIQGTLQTLLDINNKAISAVLKFCNYFNAQECGDDEGAKYINDNLYAFLKVVDERLQGKGPSNAVIADRAKGLLAKIEAHEKFIRCIQQRLTFGNKTFLVATLAISTIKNIVAMANSYKDLKKRIQDLTFLSIDGPSAWSTRNILDTLLKALQCLVARCDNPMLTTVAKMAEDQFREFREVSIVDGIDAAYFDRVPSASRESSAGTRMGAFFRLYQALMQIVNMDLNLLCNLDPTKEQPNKADPLPPDATDRVPVDPPSDRARQLAEEQSDRQKAAAAGVPFDSGGEGSALA
jgi:hypothetical protein